MKGAGKLSDSGGFQPDEVLGTLESLEKSSTRAKVSLVYLPIDADALDTPACFFKLFRTSGETPTDTARVSRWVFRDFFLFFFFLFPPVM